MSPTNRMNDMLNQLINYHPEQGDQIAFNTVNGEDLLEVKKGKRKSIDKYGQIASQKESKKIESIRNVVHFLMANQSYLAKTDQELNQLLKIKQILFNEVEDPFKLQTVNNLFDQFLQSTFPRENLDQMREAPPAPENQVEGQNQIFPQENVIQLNEDIFEVAEPAVEAEAQVEPGEAQGEDFGQFEHKVRANLGYPFAEGRMIKVLNQFYQGELGEVRCGAHALKNALVAVGMTMSPDIDAKWFSRKDVFEDLLDFIYNHLPEDRRGNVNQADISIADLDHTIQLLRESDPAELGSDVLRQFKQVCLDCPHMMSLFNTSYHGGQSRLSSFGGLAIESMSNLFDVARRPAPLMHAFVIGDPLLGEGHWVTLILKKEVGKDPVWYGCDSTGNQPYGLSRLIDDLNQAMQDVTASLDSMYEFSMAPKINQNLSIFLDNSESMERQRLPFDLDVTFKAFAFIKHVGWLNKNIHQQNPHIAEHLRVLKLFAEGMSKSHDPIYLPITPEQRAEMKRIAQTLEEALS